MLCLIFIIFAVGISKSYSGKAFSCSYEHCRSTTPTHQAADLFDGYLKISKTSHYVYPYSLNEICKITVDFASNFTYHKYYYQLKNIYTKTETHSIAFMTSSQPIAVHNCYQYENSTFILFSNIPEQQFSNGPDQLFIVKHNVIRNITLPYSISAFHFDHVSENLYLQSGSHIFKMYLDVMNDLFTHDLNTNPHDFLDMLLQIYLPRNINDLTIINNTFYFIADSISPYMNGKSKFEKPPYFRIYKMTDSINHDMLYPISNLSQFNFIPFLTYENFLTFSQVRTETPIPFQHIEHVWVEYVLYPVIVIVIALIAYFLKIKLPYVSYRNGQRSRAPSDTEMHELIRAV